jgi:hypothetical protein
MILKSMGTGRVQLRVGTRCLGQTEAQCAGRQAMAEVLQRDSEQCVGGKACGGSSFSPFKAPMGKFLGSFGGCLRPEAGWVG